MTMFLQYVDPRAVAMRQAVDRALEKVEGQKDRSNLHRQFHQTLVCEHTTLEIYNRVFTRVRLRVGHAGMSEELLDQTVHECVVAVLQCKNRCAGTMRH